MKRIPKESELHQLLQIDQRRKKAAAQHWKVCTIALLMVFVVYWLTSLIAWLLS